MLFLSVSAFLFLFCFVLFFVFHFVWQEIFAGGGISRIADFLLFAGTHFREFGIQTLSPAEWWNNYGFCGKSTKLGTMIVHDMANNTGYGAHLNLSHNSNSSRFPFCHLKSSMETRLVENILHNGYIYVGKKEKSYHT